MCIGVVHLLRYGKWLRCPLNLWLQHENGFGANARNTAIEYEQM